MEKELEFGKIYVDGDGDILHFKFLGRSGAGGSGKLLYVGHISEVFLKFEMGDKLQKGIRYDKELNCGWRYTTWMYMELFQALSWWTKKNGVEVNDSGDILWGLRDLYESNTVFCYRGKPYWMGGCIGEINEWDDFFEYGIEYKGYDRDGVFMVEDMFGTWLTMPRGYFKPKTGWRG
jgi:hypothetical protein